MPNSILSSALSKPQFVATNDVTGQVVWSNLGIVDVEIGSSSANTDFPISNQQEDQGGTIYQSILTADVESIKIIQPTVLRVTALCSDLSTIESIIQIFSDTSSTLSISTKSIITNFLCLTEVDIMQSAEMLSAAKITMVFEQGQPSEQSGFAPAQSADSSVYGVSVLTLNSAPLSALANTISAATI